MDMLLDYLPLLPIVDMKTKNNGEVFKCYAYLFHYSGHNNINVCNCNRIIAVMSSPNCTNEIFLEMVSSCLWNEV